MNTLLNLLARKYGTDKCNHEHAFKGFSFIDVYKIYFENIRGTVKNVLEIGVYEGRSLRMWKEYFINANIYGIDIDPEAIKYQDEKIHIQIGDQKSKETIDALCSKLNGELFDIIIDDGSHVNKFTIESFKMLIDKLRDGGIYIIEDTHCSYINLETEQDVRRIWPGMKYNDAESLDNKRVDLENFFLEIIKNIDKEFGDIISIHFWSKMIVVIKEKKKI